MANNIQKYRKQFGFSQDDLAQQLLVSRQTVSQWETGQTVPTTDNLMRLKEVFGVSIDELLGYADDAEALKTEEAVAEHYIINLNRVQIIAFFDQRKKQLLTRPVLLTVGSFVLTLLMLFSQLWRPAVLSGLVVLFGFYLIVSRSKTMHKEKNESLEKICASTYEYTVFENYFTVQVFRNQEQVSFFKYYFNEIKSIRLFANLLLISTSTLSFFIPKESLQAHSVFLHLYAQKRANPEASSHHQLISSLMVFVAVISLFLPFLLLAGTHSDLFSSLWKIVFFIPLPLACVVTGIVLKHKGYPRYRKNIIVGVIFAVLLAIYAFMGSFTANYNYHDASNLTKLETITHSSFPETKSIITIPYDKETTAVAFLDTDVIEPVSMTTANFDQEKQECESLVKNTAFWQHSPSKEFLDMLMPLQYSTDIYVCIYNEDEDVFNALPSKPGTYRLFSAVYYPQNGQLEINEYYLNYSR